MSEQGFLRRWARRKTEVREGRASEPGSAPLAEASPEAVSAQAAPVGATAFAAARPAPVPMPADAAAEPARPLPTLEDVAALDADSDFSAFVARGVDQAVRRGALKKLFADPHFSVMDRLDVYIDDYTKPSPVSDAMLASLEHAKSVFMKMIEDEPEAAPGQEPQAQQPQAQQPPEQETQ